MTTAICIITKQLEKARSLLDEQAGCDDVKGLLDGSLRILSRLSDYAATKSTPLSPFLKQIEKDTIAMDFDGLLKSGVLETDYAMTSAHDMLTPPGQGFGACGMAEVMAPGGKVTGIEFEKVFCDFVNERAKKNNLNVEVKQGKALSVLQELADEGHQYDLIYIDCVKEEYYDYYKIIMENDMLLARGIIVCDNVLWRGTSITRDDATGRIVDGFNTAISQDKRVTSVLLPCYDGVLLIQHNKS